MIRHLFDDGECAIKLLEENEVSEIVGGGHGGKREQKIGSRF